MKKKDINAMEDAATHPVATLHHCAEEIYDLDDYEGDVNMHSHAASWEDNECEDNANGNNFGFL